MRVLYVQDRPSGGAGESLYQIISGRKKIEDSWIIFGGEGFQRKKFEELALPQRPIYQNAHSWCARRWEDKMGLSFFWRVLVSPFHLPFLIKIIRTAKKNKIQVIHTNCIYLIEGALAAKILGLPHLWQVRELMDLDYYQYILPKSWVVRLMQRLSTKIICNSNRTKKALMGNRADEKKLSIIYNIVNAPRENKDLKAHLKLPSDTRLVAILGWISPNKRVEDFIALASKMAGVENLKFLIIGGWGGVQSYNQKIENMITASPNRKNIVHTGIIKNADQYLSSLDVLVCPCFTESFGRTVGEALAAGVPAIGVKDTAVAEIIDHGETGYLVDKGDVDKMARYVERLLSDERQRKVFGAMGQERMHERFSSKVAIPQFEALYEANF